MKAHQSERLSLEFNWHWYEKINRITMHSPCTGRALAVPVGLVATGSLLWLTIAPTVESLALVILNLAYAHTDDHRYTYEEAGWCLLNGSARLIGSPILAIAAVAVGTFSILAMLWNPRSYTIAMVRYYGKQVDNLNLYHEKHV